MSERESARTDGPYVVSLTDAAATDRALVGGKAANLARLVGAGLPVPEGFCVTTTAFQRVVDDESIRESIRELSDLDPANAAAIADAGASLRSRIRDAEFPAALRDAITIALDETTGGPEAAYAVRSSATAEDRPGASFAGQQETFLGVRGTDEVLDRVRACMASLFTDRAITYRARNDVPHRDAAIAVVVQRLVVPDVSGVCFTADPETGNRFVASVDAGLGLGEALVSGAATGDDVRVDRRTGEILDYETGDQRVAVRSRPGGGTETVELPPSEGGDRVLSDEQVRTVVASSGETERLFGRPQDVEWCLAAGEFYVLQARPITSLFPLPSPEPTDGRLHAYVSVGHGQAFAEAMPPLVRDVWMTYTQTSVAAYGLDEDARLAVEAGGRVYVDVTTLLRVGAFRRRLPTGLAATSESISVALDDLLARRSAAFRTERTARETLAAVPKLVRSAWTSAKRGVPFLAPLLDGFAGSFVGDPPDPEGERARWEAWGRDLAARIRSPDEPAERARVVFDAFDDPLDYPSLGPLFAGLAAGRLLERRFPDAPEDVNAVGRGFPKELVTRINLGLGDLADVARDRPAVADALRDGASLDEIESLDGGAAFLTAFDGYLDEFGHRATGEIDVSRPRWREDPSGLLNAVRANLERDERGAHREHLRRMEREASAAAERLERRADDGSLGSVRGRVVRQLIRTHRGGIQTREYPKHGTAYVLDACHEVLRDAGEALVADGQLSAAGDVWFLRRAELLAALAGDPVEADVGARRAEFERHTAMDAPPVLTSEGEAPNARIDRDGVPEGALVGTGVSGGVVEGVARVVRDPTVETVEDGEILVAPSSDPGWTPLFLNAAGMVVEVGGRMSHGALVAREYGLPAVASVSDATRRIRTGQRIRVDGTRGTVEFVD